MLRPFIAVGLTFGFALLACGGAVAPGESSSSSSGGSTSSGSTSSSGGGSSSGISSSSSSGGEDCEYETPPGDRVCVPGIALAGLPVTVDVDSQAGCLDCYAKLTGCDVSVNGSAITLAMQEFACSAPPNTVCDALCAQIKETCTIPPLAAGTYTVDIAGATNPFQPQTLVVAENGTGSACTLIPQGSTPPPINPSQYSTACMTDADCTTVLTGAVCGTCGCAGTAIALSDKDRYDADLRAASSQCEPMFPSPCPFCQAAIPRCLLPADSLVGTCIASAP